MEKIKFLEEKIKCLVESKEVQAVVRGMEDISGASRDDLLWWMRLRGTVFVTVWWKVVLILIYTFCILVVHTSVIRLDFPQTLIPILGVVVGLLLGFRTNSAYDRYWEGRKLWTQIIQDVRKLTRCIWAVVEEPEPKSLIEKKSALNLLLAFAVATKHYLRAEYSDQYDDLRSLIEHLPRFSTSEQLDAASRADSIKRGAQGTQLMAYDTATLTNIPIEISYYILSYIKYVNANNLAPGWAITTMQNSLTSLVDTFSNFERILKTPIPMAYSIHLHVTVWLYILSLPFQIIGTMGWMALIVVGLGSFCLLGILSVAYEIENPFGYDENDLPLDDFCRVIHAEMDMITGSRMLSAEDWMYSDLNKPFAPATNLAPKTLSHKKREELFEILVKSKQQRCKSTSMSSETLKSKDD